MKFDLIQKMVNNTKQMKQKEMKDRRYKVGEKEIAEIRRLRKIGLSYQKIADEIGGITWATAYYWANDEQRAKARIKNAKRRHTPAENKARIARDIERRKERWDLDPNAKLAHEIRSALSEKRAKRKTVRGMPLEEAKRLLESGELSSSNAKHDL